VGQDRLVKIAVTGASGLIGSALVPALRADGHQILTVVRREPRSGDEVQWDPAAGQLESSALAGVEAAVHLAGAGIADKRWSPAYKDLVLRSRVDGTRLLSERLAALDPKPRVLLSGSAVGWYGDTGDREVDETEPRGGGFLADVVQAWEQATSAADTAGIRTVHLRTGIVLSARGGAFAKQLLPAKLGLGGPLGSGRQYQSWIVLEDEVAAIRFLLTADDVAGAVNLTAPHPARQRDVATALGRALHRPAVIPTPGFAIKLLFPGFAEEGILAGQRAVPRALERAGFTWQHPDLDEAIVAALAD